MENRQVPSDANGVYSLPSGYTAITGETIQASQHNPPLEDLESAMSARLMRSGVAPMTGALKLIDGSAGSPGLTFANSPTTGLFKSTSGIGVAIDGVKVGELRFQLPVGLGPLPWSGVTAPSGWVLVYGQTLLRSAYPDLWTFAQVQIAAGNTLYNNGNGSTTFGIGDLRGRVTAGNDAMGGVEATRLTLAWLGVSAAILGAAGGAQSNTLTVATVPALTFSGVTGTENADHTHLEIRPSGAANVAGGADYVGIPTGSSAVQSGGISATHAHAFSGTTTGSGGAHANVQPTIITNSILFAGA